MAKTIENTKINKLPTSQLILYKGSPELHDEALRSKIDIAVFDRLTTEYRMQPSVARDFVNREQKIIDNRGYNLEDYAFGNDIPYAELIRVFYQNVEFPVSSIIRENNLKNFTMSELMQFCSWFNFYKCLFEGRNVGFSQFIAREEKFQRKVLNRRISILYTIYEKEDHVNLLQDLIDSIQKHQADERTLIAYNDFYKCYTFDEALQRMNEYSNARLISPLLKEASLVSQGPRTEIRKYQNIDFDAYAEYASIPGEYGITDFSLARKK